MKDLVKFFDGLRWIVKLIFALPALDGILWGIYRIAKGLSTNNTMLVLIGILWIVLGFAILWIIDIVSILLNKKLVWFV
jgi:hypothetical protein